MSLSFPSAMRAYEDRFGAPPTHFGRAPGRVNIIGEHTDYNGGYVLPMALECDTLLLARRNESDTLYLHAANLNSDATVDIARPARNPETPWADYVAGVVHEAGIAGLHIPGAEVLIIGDVPLGCGLSSSASLEMAALALFEAMSGNILSDRAAAELGQRVENRFLGLQSGIMDQFASRAAQAGHALFLDCRSLDCRGVPARLEGAAFLIIDTGVRRGLTESKYNERVEQCAEAVHILGGGAGGTLRAYSAADIARAAEEMPEVIHRRARHVVTENARTLDACIALEQGDAAALGRLMTQSHQSLRDDYEVSCAELDVLVELLNAQAGCYGARLTGAGFGGCVIALVDQADSSRLAESVMREYASQTGNEPTRVESRAGAGAQRGSCP